MTTIAKLFASSLILLGSFIASLRLAAQPVIGMQDMPQLNDTFLVSIIEQGLGIQPELTGEDFTWNYSFLVPESQASIEHQSVASTPIAYQFYFNNPFLYPDYLATFAVSGQDFEISGVQAQNIFNYFKSDEDSYKQVGIGANINGIPLSIPFDSIDFVYQFPLQYGDRDTSFIQFDASIPGLGYYGQSGTRVNHVDGWGTLTTPYGSFEVIRLKSTLELTDTVFSEILQTGFTIPRPPENSYQWLASDGGIPMMQLDEIAGEVVSIAYQDSVRTVDVRFGLLNAKKWNLYPNPASGFIHLDLGEQQQVEELVILGSDGRLHYRKEKMQFNKLRISLEDFSAGIYWVLVKTASGSGAKKFAVGR